jgi:LL-diaminopimelate aminotransferase
MSHLPKVSYRLEVLPPYGFAVIGQRIAEMTAAGKDVIRLDIGSPDMSPPDRVIEALSESARKPNAYQYGSYRGDAAFRRAVAGYYKRRFDIEVDPDKEVLPLIGSKEGIVNFTLAYVDRGDAVIVPDIAYPAYSMGARLAGGDVITIPLKAENNYLIDFDAIEGDISRAKILWVNYPNNPTGAVADLAFYEKAVEFCKAHNLILASDNPYAEIVFDGYKAPSALQARGAKDCTVEFMSMSKTYNLAGWRLGAAIGPREAIEALLVVKSNIDSGHWKSIYDAATVAINETPQLWIDERNAVYAARREKILNTLPEIGLETYKTPASLYVWAKVLSGDELAYCNAALSEGLVAVTPGNIYGDGGKGYVRFSLGGVPTERLEEGLTRLKEWYKVRV